MTDAGFHHFRPTLDPTAQEFIPTYTYPYPYATTVALPFFTNQIYYSLPSPPPPPAVTLPPPSPVPTRVLLLSSVPTHVSESTVRRELEVFGDVRAVQMDRILDGIVTVHFYDLRQAMAALNEIKEQHMQQQNRLRIHFDGLTVFSRINPIPLPPPARGLLAGRAIWAQFTFPVDAGVPDGYNQGTVGVFNLDSDVSTRVLKGIFEAYGCVKEVRDAPFKKNQKFVEFYDTRDAGKAVAGVNNQEINGKQVVVEFSRPGGHKFRYKQNKLIPISAYRQSPPPPSCRKDRPVEYGGEREVSNVNLPRNGGLKKNGKNFYKHQQSPEIHLRWLSGDGGGFGGRSNPWKGSSRYYNKEKCDPRFLIKEDGVISSFGDTRTTVMIKNIPNKYSQKLLLNLLDNHCIRCNEQAEGGGGAGDNQPLASYDFVYLPIDFVNKCNVGYGFVNMTSPEATWRLYKSFHHKNWEVFNSKKICEVSYARLQGLEALKDHFKNSKFPREVEEYMPVTFSPPRDGRTLTEPSPIIGRSITSTTTTSSWSSLMSSEVGCNDLTDGRSCDDDNNLLEEDTKSDTTITIGTTGDSSSGGGDGDGDGDGDDVGA